METTSALVVLERKLSSYRTYEEWKPFLPHFFYVKI